MLPADEQKQPEWGVVYFLSWSPNIKNTLLNIQA